MPIKFVEKYRDPTPQTLWIETHSPQSLDEVIGNEMIVETLKSYLQSDHLPNLILCGGHGCGKTTLCRLIVQQYLGEYTKSCYLEIIGSIHRGKNVVSENHDKKKTSSKSSDAPNIINFISKSIIGLQNKCRIVTIYDFDCMSSEAQMALRRVIEIYANRVRFIFVCNNLNNVIEAIQSRTLTLKFNQIELDKVTDRLRQIAELNHLQLTDDIYEAITIMGNGDLKQSINYLQIFASSPQHQIQSFYRIFNIPALTTIKTLLQHCVDKHSQLAFQILQRLIDNGYNISDILDIIIKVISYSPDLTDPQRVALIEETAKVICINENTPSTTHLFRLVVKFIERT